MLRESGKLYWRLERIKLNILFFSRFYFGNFIPRSPCHKNCELGCEGCDSSFCSCAKPETNGDFLICSEEVCLIDLLDSQTVFKAGQCFIECFGSCAPLNTTCQSNCNREYRNILKITSYNASFRISEQSLQIKKWTNGKVSMRRKLSRWMSLPRVLVS